MKLTLENIFERIKSESGEVEFQPEETKESYIDLCEILSENRTKISRELFKDFCSLGLKLGDFDQHWKKVGCEDRISFSELVNWEKCTHAHKLVYVDGIGGFKGNLYSAFGSAIHFSIENLLNEVVSQNEIVSFFESEFDKECAELELFDEKVAEDMKKQGGKILPHILPALKEKFGDYEVVKTEMRLYEPISDCYDIEFDFKGFIDLVIKTKDGRYHLIDWKSCSWGWKAEQKTDRMKTYQLTLYKHFFCEVEQVNPLQVDTHFALLKRTAKQDNVEIFDVPTGKRKVRNALALLRLAAYNIKRRRTVKNKLSCSGCEFYRTEHCPR